MFQFFQDTANSLVHLTSISAVMSFLSLTPLGHILQLKDMVRKANCLFASFPSVYSFVMTHLFRCYCLSLHGSSL